MIASMKMSAIGTRPSRASTGTIGVVRASQHRVIVHASEQRCMRRALQEHCRHDPVQLQRAAPVRGSLRTSAAAEDTALSTSDGPKLVQETVDDTCPTFIDSSGAIMEVMCSDYGFRSGSMRLYQESSGSVPDNVFVLGAANFKKELEQLRRAFRYDEFETVTAAAPPQNIFSKTVSELGAKAVTGLASLDHKLQDAGILPELQPAPVPADLADGSGDLREKLAQLGLSNEAVLKREHARETKFGKVDSPWFIRFPFAVLCWTLDVVYVNRPIQRFWVLETVARIPYFAYISMLHLYETLGWWRAGASLRKVHFAEEWNELHHLQIMESLGGDSLWVDRFLAQHGAILYYWVLIAFFLLFPSLAYNFSELVELHASDTYAEFVEANEALLKELPPPLVALEYYRGGDLYLFDDFQTSKRREPRRPECNNLYDVFANIRDDELEHVLTMTACKDNTIMSDLASKREEEEKLKTLQ